MKIKQKEITEEMTFLSHMILDCMSSEAQAKLPEGRTKETQYDIKLSFEGVELDIRKFTKHLEQSWESEVSWAARNQANNIFEKKMQAYRSKNSTNAQIAKLNKQLEKANNILLMVKQNIEALEIQ